MHAENASIQQAGNFIDTGYVNTISLATGTPLVGLRVHEAEDVTSDKIVPPVNEFSIVDSLPNITVASPGLLQAATQYQVDSDIPASLTLSEAMLWTASNGYVSPDQNGPTFSIVDAADKLVELATAEGQTSQDARLTMGDAVSVTADGGILSVDGSITLQGLYSVDVKIVPMQLRMMALAWLRGPRPVEQAWHHFNHAG